MFIVVGLGVIGSSAAYQLALRGQKVIAFDAHARGHNLGSSHGRTRITRQAYFEAPEYVPLVQRAQSIWQQLEASSGRELYSPTGAIFIGDEHGELVRGSLRSAQEHQLPHELLSGAQINSRFPAFEIPTDAIALFEPNAGILHADKCLETLQDKALSLGAELRFESAITEWSASGNSVTVRTSSGETIKGEGLVLAAGPWAPKVLSDLNLPLTVRRMLCVNFDPEPHPRFAPENLPVWCVQFNNQFLYGFPSLQEQGIKVGRHDDGEICSAETARRSVSEQEVLQVQALTQQYLPGAATSVLSTLTCLYTDTPDANFVVDRHEEYSNVVFMAGCSGHAFKFGPAIGEALADMVVTGTTELPVQFLTASRTFTLQPVL
jgi:sarcosine oxidase